MDTGQTMLRKRECRQIEPLLWGYAEGRLSEESEARVKSHLSQCPSCRVQAAIYRQTAQGVTALRSRPLPASQTNWQDVRAALTRARSAQPSARRALIPAWIFPVRSRMAWAGMGTLAAVCLLLFSMPPLREPALTTARPAVAKPDMSLVTPTPHKVGAHLPARYLLQTGAAKYAGRMKIAGLKIAGLWSGAVPEMRRNPAHSFVRTASSLMFTAHGSRRRTKRSRWLLAAGRSAQRPFDALSANAVDAAGSIQANAAELLAQNLSLSNRQADSEPPQDAPDYVLTVVEDSVTCPRDYVMDSVSGEASRAARSPNNSTMKEIRAW